jgi:hypothetical protein
MELDRGKGNPLASVIPLCHSLIQMPKELKGSSHSMACVGEGQHFDSDGNLL